MISYEIIKIIKRQYKSGYLLLLTSDEKCVRVSGNRKASID